MINIFQYFDESISMTMILDKEENEHADDLDTTKQRTQDYV